MEDNKYDGVCVLFLCAIAPLFYMIFFPSNMFVQVAYVGMSAVSVFFWILLT